MESVAGKVKRERTWYGLNATIVIGPGFIHKAGVGRMLIPHPPLVNWLLRRGLDREVRFALSYSHEFAHFQTAPVALPYTLTLVVAAIAAGHTGLLEILAVIISAHAAWEIMAEAWIIGSDRRFYRLAYEGATTGPRLVFWILAIGFTFIGWTIFLI